MNTELNNGMIVEENSTPKKTHSKNRGNQTIVLDEGY